MKSFFVQTPVKVGAKNNRPSFYSLNYGSVQIPTNDNLAAEPGRSFRVMDIVDL